jgi:membrane protein YdbS with pleckstrin-like domain
MSYVQKVLQPGESILYETKISWTTYVAGVVVLVVATVIYVLLKVFVPSPVWLAEATGAIVLLIGLVMLLVAWFERWTTEIAITTRRIILKRGFIRRDTAEMHMEKVESVDVNQSFLGRILDYGDVTVRGTGAGLETLRQIDAPLEFRNHVKTHDHPAISAQ